MTSAVEELYKRIANSLAGAVDEEWSRIRLEVEIEDDNASTTCRYVKGAGDEEQGFFCPDDAYDAIEELRELLGTSEEKVFTGAVFTLEHDGTFDLDFSYD